ncbi:unnamed protein product [Periconia digitata]|uniref:Uncharacterized protein n=1 Tax=Periconia digitata TaxID=1303443 RepID=A0A9W4UH62_9PLEO|nr:unnamed protein product [Periconia digitata]
MCNGHSARTSQGGSIAVLRPSSPSQNPSSDSEIKVLFSNSFATSLDQPGTQVQFHGLETSNSQPSYHHWLIIHRDGNLNNSTNHSLPPVDPFFSFALNSQDDSVLQLNRTLDLGVGETGIIGRRISMMAGEQRGERVIAEGIIGWN